MKKRTLAAFMGILLLFITAGAYSPNAVPYETADILARVSKLLKPAEEQVPSGEGTGSVYFCADAFVLGAGYIVFPMKTEIYPGDNAAAAVTRSISESGLSFANGGSLSEGFYLRKILGADTTVSIQPELEQWLRPLVSYYEPDSLTPGELGEYDVTDMSGWLFYINGEMPDTSMSDCPVNDGDIISLRFTLALGMDLGEEAFDGSAAPYAPKVNRDRVTVALAEGKLDYGVIGGIISKPDVTQEEIDELF